jgi:nucleoside-diphosphate-sugar epimerase
MSSTFSLNLMAPDLTSQRIAVTGPTGFIGMHLLRALHAAGAHIIAIVADGRRPERIAELPFPVETIVVEDVSRMGDAIRQANPRYVIHLNGHITTERSLSAIQKTIEWNLLSTLSLLTACSEMGTERVLLMGSCEEYGQDVAPFDTRLAPDPSSPYGASKAAATAYARMFTNSFKLPTVVLRPSVVYGPGQSPRMLISMVMRALAEGRVIDVTEGRQTRDFLYVSDLVDALLLALVTPNLAGEIWNLGSGEVVTVRDCLQRIERITGRAGLIDYGGRPYVDREIFRYEINIEPTCAAFQWRPAVMLDEGLRLTWESFSGGA